MARGNWAEKETRRRGMGIDWISINNEVAKHMIALVHSLAAAKWKMPKARVRSTTFIIVHFVHSPTNSLSNPLDNHGLGFSPALSHLRYSQGRKVHLCICEAGWRNL